MCMSTEHPAYAKEFLKRYMSSGGLMMTAHVLRILWS